MKAPPEQAAAASDNNPGRGHQKKSQGAPQAQPPQPAAQKVPGQGALAKAERGQQGGKEKKEKKEKKGDEPPPQ